MGTQTALIFGAMPCRSWGHLDALRAEKPLVICADGGVHCAAAAGFAPDCYVGDGDSGGTAVAGAENILLRPEKDESDLQAAYTMARAHGCTRLYLTACTGGWIMPLPICSCWKRLALMVSRPSCSTPIIA